MQLSNIRNQLRGLMNNSKPLSKNTANEVDTGRIKKWNLEHRFLDKSVYLTDAEFQDTKKVLDRMITIEKKQKLFLNRLKKKISLCFILIISALIKVTDFFNIKKVRASALEYGGSIDLKFCQTDSQWLTHMAPNSETRVGVCWGLSVAWLWKESNNENLSDFIYDDPNKRKINSESYDFISSVHLAANHGSENLREVLNLFNLRPTVKNTALAYPSAEFLKDDPNYANFDHPDSLELGNVIYGNSENPKELPEELTDEIISMDGDNEAPLKLVYFYGGKDAHATAVHVKGEDITFFDSAFGAFAFRGNKQQFKKWFCTAYWPQSGFSKLFSIAEVVNINKVNTLEC